MNLTISGHHLEVTPALREYVLTKLDRVTRHFDAVVDVNVLLTVENLKEKERRQKAEVTLHVKGKDIFVEQAHEDLYAAVDQLMDKLDRQVVRHKDRLQDHHHATGNLPGDFPARGPPGVARKPRPDPPGTLMNRLAAILPLANVQVGADATSKKRVFEQAGVLFENQHAIARATVTDNLFARERLGSTGLGHGVAVPHGRVKGLKNPLAAVLRVQTPIPFDAPDDEPVGLLIFLLVPEAATQRHLEILSEIAEMLSDRELRERLKGDVDAVTLHRLVSDWEPLKSVA